MYDFAKFKTIESFGDAIRNNKVTMGLVNEEKNQLAKNSKNLWVIPDPEIPLRKMKKKVFKIVHWRF